MMRADGTAGDKPSGEFAEAHVRVGFNNLKTTLVDFLLELGFDDFGLPAVGSPGGTLMANAIAVDVGPPDVAAFKQAH